MGSVGCLEAKLDLSNTDYKNTPKLTWLADTSKAPPTPTVCVHFEHLITKGVLKPDDDFKDYVNRDSKVKRSIFRWPHTTPTHVCRDSVYAKLFVVQIYNLHKTLKSWTTSTHPKIMKSEQTAHILLAVEKTKNNRTQQPLVLASCFFIFKESISFFYISILLFCLKDLLKVKSI